MSIARTDGVDSVGRLIAALVSNWWPVTLSEEHFFLVNRNVRRNWKVNLAQDTREFRKNTSLPSTNTHTNTSLSLSLSLSLTHTHKHEHTDRHAHFHGHKHAPKEHVWAQLPWSHYSPMAACLFYVRVCTEHSMSGVHESCKRFPCCIHSAHYCLVLLGTSILQRSRQTDLKSPCRRRERILGNTFFWALRCRWWLKWQKL
jgi:hypothetical protein